MKREWVTNVSQVEHDTSPHSRARGVVAGEKRGGW